ncbi:peptidoglycan/xylan/chitin deacetylase (PgdA/CDA1 family) [Paenibacillus phyllosphaerae]|uniref:Peptidoglycan/xylan/chitin deacetylase (PgdA/CDA1 family) n=1 Tax=Paenibacillus phyllosphaerae TaxID=274593 RepID=A0A7W5AW65_9BACL|nr:polysaccharide deacetylase family protein [Paenibacillus phyllosphaerae]MBB3109251.1 peptidoglycan/xylan/chitin deacetylase (PgdA/CDA1 family) [Paenibacillus phyllosphaerae]
MIQNLQRITIATVLLSLLVACGNNSPSEQSNNIQPENNANQTDNGKGGNSASPKTNSNSVTKSVPVPVPAPASDQPASANSQTAPETSADKQAPMSEAPSKREKLYRMNDAYRFVPIEGTNAPKKAVLLTFDDGPKDDETLTAMLDTLDKHHAKAIFFVNGYRVKAKPELLKKIAERGQTIGNHSWEHIDLKQENESVITKQIGDVQSIVKETTGTTPRFFRPPFGSGGDKVKKIAADQGLLYMTWSNGSLDWDSSTKDKPDKVIANVLEQLHSGANILMHELPWTKDALDSLLTKLKDKGYTFIDPATIETNEKSQISE